MKEFNLEEAKAGAPVCTRNNLKVRILCFDAKDRFPIITLIEENGKEFIQAYPISGKFPGRCSDYDLMIYSTKKSGYVNIYSEDVHKTLYEAQKNINPQNGYIKTVKVDWLE